ncbi:unnamed protein product [Prunus armeniaca]
MVGLNFAGYGHISSECANTLKKQKDGKNKAMHTTWSDSESECENDEKTIALITTVSLDESHEDDDCKGINIEFIMNKYDDLLAASQKLSKQNSELVKEVAVLKLENCRIANEFQSPDADSEKLSAKKIDKMISMGRRDGDKRGLGFEPSNQDAISFETNLFVQILMAWVENPLNISSQALVSLWIAITLLRVLTTHCSVTGPLV